MKKRAKTKQVDPETIYWLSGGCLYETDGVTSRNVCFATQEDYNDILNAQLDAIRLNPGKKEDE